ncbi:hypothetical protein [Endozoicomonas sp. ALB032]|uniref:hypothetical protein n=1 Tax=Endozoicomonas sp. ALB032 TaxID=3403082 RepID=UPI003BB7F105
MKKSFNLFPLLLCLFYSTTQASPPSQNDFDFLKPLNDTALVANGLELTESIAGVSVSTLLNLGIWWAVCKTAGIVTGLSDTYDLAASDTKELEELKTDFCWQLAPVITTAEVALAGHVSSWPLELHWWKLLYLAGAGMDIYVSMTETRQHIPAEILTYLASEALLRTGASAISVSILRKTRFVREITTKRYVTAEYAILSAINGVMVGTVTYEALIHKGIRPAKANLAAVVSAAIVGALSGISSGLTADVDEPTKTGFIAGVKAAVIVRLGVGSAQSGAGLGVLVGLSGALAGASAGLGDVVGIFKVVVGSTAAFIGAGTLVSLASLKTDNLCIKAGVTLVPALTFAVINSLSNYAVYGYPLEQSLSETAWTQWKKFYAPLDYLSTLFK